MVLASSGRPLTLEQRPDPLPGPSEVRVRVEACGVCRTDLHVVDSELPDIHLPIVPGHEIVGIVERLGPAVTSLAPGRRVGIPWLGHTCGVCPYCVTQHENLCDRPVFTGYTRDGGFATQVIADAAFAFPLDGFDDPVATVRAGSAVRRIRRPSPWTRLSCSRRWARWCRPRSARCARAGGSSAAAST
jgi:alcohol dehydrogenase, propanol-preferring